MTIQEFVIDNAGNFCGKGKIWASRHNFDLEAMLEDFNYDYLDYALYVLTFVLQEDLAGCVKLTEIMDTINSQLGEKVLTTCLLPFSLCLSISCLASIDAQKQAIREVLKIYGVQV